MARPHKDNTEQKETYSRGYILYNPTYTKFKMRGEKKTTLCNKQDNGNPCGESSN